LRDRDRLEGELETGRDFEKDRRKEKSKQLCSREFLAMFVIFRYV
jgi:hypothetical protein